jgi:indole-3-glycerol phosphate synthase
LITNGKNEFDQDIVVLNNNFRVEYDQLLEAYNGGQCAMLLIKNVITTSKGDQYMKALQHYTILTKVVDKATQACLLQLHNKLSSVQLALKEVSLFSILCIIQIFFQTYMKNIKQNQMFISWSTILEKIMKIVIIM